MPRLINIATRGRAGWEAELLIAGLAARGNAPRQVLIRALDPPLAGFGVPGASVDPWLVLRRGNSER